MKKQNVEVFGISIHVRSVRPLPTFTEASPAFKEVFPTIFSIEHKHSCHYLVTVSTLNLLTAVQVLECVADWHSERPALSCSHTY